MSKNSRLTFWDSIFLGNELPYSRYPDGTVHHARRLLIQGFQGRILRTRSLVIGIEPPEGMQKEEYEEWISIDEDIPVAATLTGLEICQAACQQDQAINIDDSDEDECFEVNPPTNAEMRQAYDILKLGVQHRSTNYKKQYEYEQYK
ncbi:hypothetical protein AVEN_34740-1 [Araneus ventricosus]|uniref:Uncharacterized protein n=1 Tax=Araneus ventricosus TaxID=182803 RepID=A0A4Y2GQ21_ARAVE|nr:hypothetical protein AVEN_34740-1 [Araneus ventricosus]